MSSLTYTQIETLVKDNIIGNTSTDAPIGSGATSEMLRAINAAYAIVWEISGGGLKNAASATLWTTAQTATGVVVGALAGIKEIVHLFASSTSGSVGVSSGDNELDHVELSEIQWYRKAALTGSYDRPKKFAVTRLDTTTAADVGKLRLDYYPGVTGYYFPADYLLEFTVLDGTGATVPAVNDIEGYDIVWIASADLLQRVGRHDLVPGMLMKVSEGTTKALDRKLATLMDASQDR